VPSTLPEGDPVPADGSLPSSAAAGLERRTLSIYLHVPFCATRCGYCDFNTYTAGELGSAASPHSWEDAARAEIGLARRTLTALGDTRSVSTVFVGGGTPSLVGAGPLTRLLGAIRDQFGLADDAEVTTEANPESTDAPLLQALRDAGYTRLSLGMQSASPRVLAVLDRVHTPGRPAEVVGLARRAGFEHISLDLIYGTPGETDAELVDSVRTALATGVDHLSAYSLIVEPGTRMARQVAAGLLRPPAEDTLADRYELVDALATAAGLQWYEVSNWAAGPTASCRHNLAYWRGDDWWGIGPGAHSHVGGVRWWNVKHPARYAAALGAGRSPGQAREILDDDAKHTEAVLLRLRLAEGMPVELLTGPGRARLTAERADGLVDVIDDRVVLTDAGRLLADGIALRLLD
jgi:oxygen-independent coproporphyrinogen-3 oxidase